MNREEELAELQKYLAKTDTEITMILQSLQWDQKYLLESKCMCSCKYDSNHKVPINKINVHTKECYFKRNGYSKQDLLFPDPIENKSGTLVKLDKSEINNIIKNIAQQKSILTTDNERPEPLNLERLRSEYTPDQRRAIYDSVVARTPSHSDIVEMDLPSGQQTRQKPKSKLEVLAELRNMKRRRVKYRVATKTNNYSEVLREVIKNQMEWYSEIESDTKDADRTKEASPPHDHSSRSESRHRPPYKEIQSKPSGSGDRKYVKDHHDSRYEDKRHRDRERSRERHGSHSMTRHRRTDRQTHKRDHERSKAKNVYQNEYVDRYWKT